MQHTIELGNMQRQKLQEINHAKLQFLRISRTSYLLLYPLFRHQLMN